MIVWQAVAVVLAQAAVLLLASPLVVGLIRKVKARLQCRRGAGLLQPYADLAKLFRKEPVVSTTASWIFTATPYILFASTLAAGGRRASETLQRRGAERRAQLEQWEALCRDLGAAPADVALAWLLHNPAVTAPIIGPRTCEQLDQSLRALELRLAPETLARLEQSVAPATETAS